MTNVRRRAGWLAVLVGAGVLPAVPSDAAVAAPARTVAGPRPAAAAGPPDKVCQHNNPKLREVLLTPAEAAQPTWPQTRLGYLDAHRFTQGRNVTVAVVDSGVDGTQEYLRGRVLPGFDVTTGRVLPGANRDCLGHGTMVAGVIAGAKRPGRAFVGMAPGATILPVRETWGVDQYGSVPTMTAKALLTALQVAVTSKASVVNVSVTVDRGAMRPADVAAFQAVARLAEKRDVLIVAATGNKSEYNGKNPVTYPAALSLTSRNVIAVSGVTIDAKRTVLPDDQSITGPFVTVAAPDDRMPCPMDRGGLVPCTGTSFAAPFVSGLAALLRSRYPQLHAADIRKRIEVTADHPSVDLPDPSLGYGIINPVAAVTGALSPPMPAASPSVAEPLVRPPSDAAIRRTTTVVAAGSVGLVAVVLLGWAALRRGRRRGWAPGRVPASGQVRVAGSAPGA